MPKLIVFYSFIKHHLYDVIQITALASYAGNLSYLITSNHKLTTILTFSFGILLGIRRRAQYIPGEIRKEKRDGKMIRISVIVPIYKAEKYLERCVDSILNQTYKDLELILVDDGSPDSCPFLCDQYAKKDSRVIVIHKKNGGVSTARNAGLDVAKGDYITFVDSDDYLELNMYENMMAKAILHDCDVVMCDCVKDFSNNSVIYSHDIRGGFYNYDQLKGEYYPHLLMMENVEYPATISNVTLLWRSSLNTSNMRYEPGIRFSEDLLFGAKLLYAAKSFYYMKHETYYHYVMNPGSASHTYVPDKWNDYQILYRKIREEFDNCEDYDFSKQIDKCLLFFLYNTIGEIYTVSFSDYEKLVKIRGVLTSPSVNNMFKRLKITRLKVSMKQKILTLIYKYQIGLPILIYYFRKKQ